MLDAVDGSTVTRIDRLGEIHFDPERQDGMLARVDAGTGFLRVDAKISRTGVQLYSDADGNTWGEYRDPVEVFHPDALRSFEMSVLTNDHPAEFVTARNVKDVQVGHAGSDVRRDGIHVAASIVVTDADTIAAIKKGKTELSCGYTATLVRDTGATPEGATFAARQTNIRGNHVAIVDHGRAGPECRLLLARGDAFNITQKANMPHEEITIDTVKVDIEGQSFDVAPEVAKALAAKADAGLPFDTDKDEDEEDNMPNKNDTGDLVAMQAKIDALEADATSRRDSEGARIDARVALVTDAREILGSDAKTDGATDDAIRRAVIVKVNPGLKDRLDANKNDAGYLRASFDACLDLHRSRTDAVEETGRVIFDAMQAGEREDLDAIETAYHDRYKHTGNAVKAES